MIERLPTPWCCIRFGVAPDHPNFKTVRACSRRSRTAPASAFSGTSRSGVDVTHEELSACMTRWSMQSARRPIAGLGHPGRGPAGLVGGDRVRRLVQRPPRLPGSRVRPLEQSAPSSSGTGTSRWTSRGCSRSRRGARADGHNGRGDRGDPRLGDPGDRRPRPARPRPGGLTSTELEELGDLAGADVVVDPAEPRADPRARPSSADERRPAEHGHPPRVRRARAESGKPRSSASASACRRWRSSGRNGSRRSRSRATGSRPTARSVRAVATDEREVIPCGLVFRSVGYRGAASGCPYDERSGTIPNEGGRVLREDAARSRASTARAGSSAAPPGSSGRTRRTRRTPSSSFRGRSAVSTGPRSGGVDRRPACRARCRRDLLGLGGDRRARAPPRRAARPATRQALQLGRAARRPRAGFGRNGPGEIARVE